MPHYYIVQMAFGLIAVGLFSFFLWKRSHWSFALFLFWALSSGVVTLFWHPCYFDKLAEFTRKDIATEAARALVCFSFVCILTAYFRPWWSLVIGLGNAFCMILMWSFGNAPIGIMLNPAQDSGLIAMVIPIGLSILDSWETKGIFLLLTLMAIFISKATTGPLAVAAAFFGLALAIREWRLIVGCVVAPAITIAIIGKDEFFNPSGRYTFWSMYMQWWEKYAPHWQGTELGSFAVYGPTIMGWDFIKNRPMDPPPTQVALWMHNEVLQVLFELGFIGLALAVICFAIAIYKGYRKPFYFASLFAMIPNFMLQMPLRNVVSAMVVGFVFMQCFSKEEFTFEERPLGGRVLD